MCCFSRPVVSVSATNIFARSGLQGRQYLAYSMRLNAREDLAMILPLPVKPHSGEKAVRFINLEAYPDFFEDMAKGFTLPSDSQSKGAFSGPLQATPLAVVEVGSFEASFVPTIQDFHRLDARFRLPEGTWEQLPQYKTYGFAVFKLKEGAQRIHPMAFDFPRADTERLFFPTVHIHDGKVHGMARFDHALYCQKSLDEMFSLTRWRESYQQAKQFLRAGSAHNLILPDAHCYQFRLNGARKNTDIWLG